MAGLTLDPWQAWLLEQSLAERPDGLWSSFTVAAIVARQNGKGALLEARELAGLFLLDEQLILHSAHEFKTTYEAFLRITNLVEGCPDLDREVQKIRRGAGEQAIELRNGNRLRFIARTGGSGRGMSAPLVVLDECMFLTEAMLGAIMPTLSAQPNPQLWLTGSAPLSTSVPMHRIRNQAIDGDADRLLFAEWGNDADADPYDLEAIARANPALGIRLSMEFIEAERDAMAPGEFARERLGVPDPISDTMAGPIAAERWQQLIDGDSLPTDESLRLALDVPPDRASASFAIAGKRDDNLHHVSLRYQVAPPEMGELVNLAKQLTDGHNVPLILPPTSPAKAWRTELLAAGVPLDELTHAEYAEACGLMLAKVGEGSIRHRGIPEMMSAVAGLGVRRSGDVETWSRRSSSANIAPFVAATCALVRVSDMAPSFDGDWFVDLDSMMEDDE